MLFSLTINLLLIGIVYLFFCNSTNKFHIKRVALLLAGFILICSCALVISFKSNILFFQDIITYTPGSSLLNLTCSFGIDGIGVYFFFLSSLLIFICVLFIWNDSFFREYVINLFLIQLFLLIVFFTLDLFIFYIFFEAILVPMFLTIGIWGSRDRKIRAVYLFFFYTLCGSILLLISIFYIFVTVGTLNLQYLLSW